MRIIALLLALALLMSLGMGAVPPTKQSLKLKATSISTDGVENTEIYETVVFVYPKDAPALKIRMWTDKQNYSSGERIFAHVNAQFLNKTDVGEIVVWADGVDVPVIDTRELPAGMHPVNGNSVRGADWDVLAGFGNSTPS